MPRDVSPADDLHALRLERKWWLHRAAQVQARIDALEFCPDLPADATVVLAGAGCAVAVSS